MRSEYLIAREETRVFGVWLVSGSGAGYLSPRTNCNADQHMRVHAKPPCRSQSRVTWQPTGVLHRTQPRYGAGKLAGPFIWKGRHRGWRVPVNSHTCSTLSLRNGRHRRTNPPKHDKALSSQRQSPRTARKPLPGANRVQYSSKRPPTFLGAECKANAWHR